MKKIIAITAMAAMVAAAAMADEPAVDLNIAEFKGDASVTWGFDLDSTGASEAGRTGFKNATSASIKLNIVNAGDKTTEGEGIWGEAKVKLDNAFVAKAGNDGDTMALADGKVVLDTAKLHIGDLYIGIKAGDTQVGSLNLPNAVKSDKYGVGDKGANATQGLVVGYGNDLFGVDVDFRSLPDADTKDYLTDKYAVAAQAELKDLAGFSAKVGGSFGFKAEDFKKKQLGLFGSAAYKLALGDNSLKVSGAAGFEGVKGSDGKLHLQGEAAGSVLFAWGDQADANAGVYYLDNDNAKKVTPGVGVAVYVPLAEKTYIDIVPAFYSGEIVENLTAAVAGEIELPVGYDGAGNLGLAVAGGAKYKLAIGDSISITPQAGFRFANSKFKGGKTGLFADDTTGTDLSGLKDNAAGDGLLNVKAGVDIGGVIPNTTFSAVYQSRNLFAEKDKAGIFSITAKIAF